MRSEPTSALRGLLLRLIIGALGAVAVIAAGPIVGFAAAPVPTVIIGVFLGGLVWLSGLLAIPDDGPAWSRPQPPGEHARLNSDVRVRRLALMLAHSRPGAGFETTSLAVMLRELVTERLTGRQDVPPVDPLDHADGLLSPQLLAHLRAESPPPLKSNILHAYLKEIDEL